MSRKGWDGVFEKNTLEDTVRKYFWNCMLKPTNFMMIKQNNQYPVRVYHQECARNLPDEKNQKLEKNFPPVDNLHDLLKKNTNTITKEVFDHKRSGLLSRNYSKVS